MDQVERPKLLRVEVAPQMRTAWWLQTTRSTVARGCESREGRVHGLSPCIMGQVYSGTSFPLDVKHGVRRARIPHAFKTRRLRGHRVGRTEARRYI